MNSQFDNSFFTVAVPTYNSARYIEQCLGGILSQTFTDFNLNIIDDCSTDNTLEIADKFLPEFEKKGITVTVIKNEPNIGGYANFNKCIDTATGRYLFINHADDVMKPEMLEKVRDTIKAHGDFSILHVNSNEISENNIIQMSPYFQWTKHDIIFNEQKGHPFLKIFLKKYHWSVAQTIYNVDFIQSNNIKFIAYPDKHDCGQDFVFFVDLMEHATKIIHIQTPCMFRRMADTQWSKKSKLDLDHFFSCFINETVTEITKKTIALHEKCSFHAKKLTRRFFYNQLMVHYKKDFKKRLDILRKYKNRNLFYLKNPFLTNLYLELERIIQLTGRRIKRILIRLKKRDCKNDGETSNQTSC